jgi:hypothetical protein
MGTGSGGRKRSRREREKALAAGVIDDAVAKEGQIRALGTAVNADVPDSSLFVEDRAGVKGKDALRQTAGGRLSKKALRKIPRHRRSEHALALDPEKQSGRVSVPGRKAQRDIAGVDLAILNKRTFPKRRVLMESGTRELKVAEDVWGSKLAVEVQAAKSKVRKSVEARLHAPVRASVSVLAPDNGISINPLDESHQDALGMAVAAQYDRLDNAEWAKAAITPKPSVLLEPDIRVADDQSDEDGDGSDEISKDMLVFAGAPERKSRSERNRAARRRQAEAQQVRRRARVNQAKQIDNIEKLCAMADVEVRKLEGGEAAARRRRALELASLNRDPTRAAPRVRKFAGVRVPTENADI